MARNIEIKVRISKLEEWLPRAAALADSPPVTISQDDTFFLCPNGRLKLRAFGSGGGELIFYQPEDCAEPKESHYVLAPVAGGGLGSTSTGFKDSEISWNWKSCCGTTNRTCRGSRKRGTCSKS